MIHFIFSQKWWHVRQNNFSECWGTIANFISSMLLDYKSINVYWVLAKTSPVSGHRLAPKCTFFWGGKLLTWYIVYAGTKFPIYKVWWLREASQIGQMFIYPIVGKSFQTQQLAAIGHRFIAKKRKLNMLTCGSEVTHAETRNGRLFLNIFFKPY